MAVEPLTPASDAAIQESVVESAPIPAAQNPATETVAIPHIQDSVELGAQPRDFLERYYECRYALDRRQPGHDYRLLFHSNGLIALMLAPSHPLVAGAATVTDIDFQVTEHTNRLQNKVSGKGKRGAQLVTADAPLFRVTCADGTRYAVPACVHGKLVQLNERLRAEPQRLVTDSGGTGFVALILPKLGTSRKQMTGTVDAAEYARRRPAGGAAKPVGDPVEGTNGCAEPADGPSGEGDGPPKSEGGSAKPAGGPAEPDGETYGPAEPISGPAEPASDR